MEGRSMASARLRTADDTERAVCAVICRHQGIKAKEIAQKLSLDRTAVNRVLYSSPLLHELCWQDDMYQWHGIVRQQRPHWGLQEFSGYYGLVREFLALDEDVELISCLDICGRASEREFGLDRADCRIRPLFGEIQ